MRFIKLYFLKCEIDDPVIYLDSDFVRLKKISLSFIDLQELFNILQFFFRILLLITVDYRWIYLIITS